MCCKREEQRKAVIVMSCRLINVADLDEKSLKECHEVSKFKLKQVSIPISQ